MNQISREISQQQVATKTETPLSHQLFRAGMLGVTFLGIANAACSGQESQPAPAVPTKSGESEPGKVPTSVPGSETPPTAVPEKVKLAEGVVALERGNKALEDEFAQVYGFAGTAYIFHTSELQNGATSEDLKLILTPIIVNENGGSWVGTDVYIKFAGTWTPLSTAGGEQSLAGEELAKWQQYISESSISGFGSFDVSKLTDLKWASVNNPDGNTILIERAFVANDSSVVHEFFVTDGDGNIHQVQFDFQSSEIAAMDIMTDAGRVFFVDNENSSMISIPSTVFEQIKTYKPILAANGREILNGVTNAVIAELQNGEWVAMVIDAPDSSITPEEAQSGEETVEKNYEWEKEVENFEKVFVPVEDIFDGSFHKWLMRQVLPNVEYEDNQQKPMEAKSFDNENYFILGFPGRSIKAVANFYTIIEGKKYQGSVDVYEGKNGVDFAIPYLLGYDESNVIETNKMLDEMRYTPFMIGSKGSNGEDIPFMIHTLNMLGSDITMDELKKYLAEDLQTLPSNASFKLLYDALDELSEEQIAELTSNLDGGGMVYATYMFRKGDPSVLGQPGLVLSSFFVRGEGY